MCNGKVTQSKSIKNQKANSAVKGSCPAGDFTIAPPPILKGFFVDTLGTYIYLFRKIGDTSFYKDSYAFHLAIHCLLKANRFAKKVIIGNQAMDITIGQFVTGRHKLHLETGIAESTIRNKLFLLCKVRFMDIKATTKYSIITVINYEKYQLTLESRTATKPTDGQQENTIKKDKKDKNNKNIVEDDFPHLKNSSFKELWDSWLEVRKIKKVPNTDRALKIALGKLQVHPLDTAIQMLEKAVEGGWKGIYKLKEIKEGVKFY